MNPIQDYLTKCNDLVAAVARQEREIRKAAVWFADSILAGRMVHVFGSGHSRIMVEEMWPRYGSFPGFNPIVELSMTFHNLVVGANGQRQAMFIERVPGLAKVAVLARLGVGQIPTEGLVNQEGDVVYMTVVADRIDELDAHLGGDLSGGGS